MSDLFKDHAGQSNMIFGSATEAFWHEAEALLAQYGWTIEQYRVEIEQYGELDEA
jgi:hypothetical protein